MKRKAASRGYAMLTVTVFALVMTIAGTLFFSLPSAETRQAMYRQRSSEAFYLADAAVEHARAKFLADRSWWRPPNLPTFSDSLGRGRGELTVTQLGTGDSVQLVADGYVQNAHRRIEVQAEVPPTALDIPLFIGGDLNAGGNLCVHGTIHVNGHGDDQHLNCDYTLSGGFDIEPPPIYTDPGHFPDATYYYVMGTKNGNDPPEGRIYDAGMNDITGPNTMTDVISWDAGANQFHFDFGSNALVNKYFNNPNAVFQRNPGDVAAVVNFGEANYDPQGSAGPEDVSAEVLIDGNSGNSIHATIIDTRFVGTTVEDRLDPDRWFGGPLVVKQITFEPYYGIAMICADFGKQGSSLAQVGSPDYPALLYVTNDVGQPYQLNSNFVLYGSIVCLGDWYSTGGPELFYDSGFIDNLPDYLQDDWDGSSGSLKIMRWREIAAN